MKRSAQKQYFKELIKSKRDSKSIWKAINELSCKKSKSSGLICQDLTPEKLNKHFTSIVERTVKINATQRNDLYKLKQFCSNKDIRSKQVFPFISVHEVYKELSSLKQSRSHGLDGLDSKILKLSAPIISEHITYIYNLCIDKNCFPQAFKIAKVLPVFKSGDTSDPSNYRPISILPILSKILERHLKHHLQSHFTKYDLFHRNQNGFREKHSCHTMLTNIIEEWHLNINNNKFTGSLFIDFAKAFDTIEHNLLLKNCLCMAYILIL